MKDYKPENFLAFARLQLHLFFSLKITKLVKSSQIGLFPGPKKKIFPRWREIILYKYISQSFSHLPAVKIVTASDLIFKAL